MSATAADAAARPSSETGPGLAPSGPRVTIIQPDAVAPADRLAPWLFASGAALTTVRLWEGAAVPALAELGDAVVILGGNASANSDVPWIGELEALVRDAVAAGLPVVGICLGAQIAAKALGGTVVSPAPGMEEQGVVRLSITEDGHDDPFFQSVVHEAVHAAVRAGVSTQDGNSLPVLADHHDAITALPEGARLLASTEACPNHVWRLGSVFAYQQHPEASPRLLADWGVLDGVRAAGLDWQPGDDVAELPEELRERHAQVLAEAEGVDAVTQAFGRALAGAVLRRARAFRSSR